MNNNSKLLLAVAVALTFAVAPVASAQETGGYGSKVMQGDSDFLEQFVGVDTADDVNAALWLVQCDPDADTDGDELYYLRIAEDASGDDEVQELDLDLQAGELVADGDEATDCSESDVTEAFEAFFPVISYTENDEVSWYVDVDDTDTITRFDLRLTEIEVDGETYEPGSQVGLGDNDFELFDGAAVTDDVDLALADMSWFDADDDEEFSEGDSLLLASVNGDDADVGDPEDFAQIDDVRLLPDFGTIVGQGAGDLLEQFVGVDTADENVAGDTRIIECDPDTDTDGDELYYLRVVEDAGADPAVQELDLDLLTGELVADGDEATDCAESDVTEDIQGGAGPDLIAFDNDDELNWYWDVVDVDGPGADGDDDSDVLNRYDIRLTEVTIDGETYEAGSRVALGDNDLELFAGAADDDALDLDGADLSWFDVNDDEEFDDSDVLLFQPGGVENFAQLDDVYLVNGVGYGEKAVQGGEGFRAQFDAVSTADNVDVTEFGVVQCDPDADTDGDELYYLRVAEDESADPAVQELDLDLQTGEIVADGDEATDCAESDVTLEYFGTVGGDANEVEVVGLLDEDEDYWYIDIDSDAEVSRFDLRLTDIEVDGEEYEAGSLVGLGDNDIELFGGTVADDDGADEACFVAAADLNGGDGDCVLSLDALDFSWYDADDDEEWSEGDALLLNLRGVADVDDVEDFAQLNDIRLFGEVDVGVTPPTTPPVTPPVTPPGTTPPGTTPPGTTPPGTTPPGTTPPTTPPEEKEDKNEPTPGFELVALVAALGAALVLVRRKA